jgi:hypothetical protein
VEVEVEMGCRGASRGGGVERALKEEEAATVASEKRMQCHPKAERRRRKRRAGDGQATGRERRFREQAETNGLSHQARA